MQAVIFKTRDLSFTSGIEYSKTKGFTLIEMLIGIVIMGVAISMLSVAMSQSVRNQEKMQQVLDVYQLALTTRTQIIERLEQNQLSGVLENGNAQIQWNADKLEQKDEASVLVTDVGRYSQPKFSVALYNVTVIYQTPYIRRVYNFDHMVEADKFVPSFLF